ncbi:hypothetical protein CcaverHIS002_0602260 [Cutaneotrichosporon cavernicola]|nr:hypothetical protein CcaverHIS002_0602260 [Cutaneotrichosporon cavernicola]
MVDEEQYAAACPGMPVALSSSNERPAEVHAMEGPAVPPSVTAQDDWVSDLQDPPPPSSPPYSPQLEATWLNENPEVTRSPTFGPLDLAGLESPNPDIALDLPNPVVAPSDGSSSITEVEEEMRSAESDKMVADESDEVVAAEREETPATRNDEMVGEESDEMMDIDPFVEPLPASDVPPPSSMVAENLTIPDAALETPVPVIPLTSTESPSGSSLTPSPPSPRPARHSPLAITAAMPPISPTKHIFAPAGAPLRLVLVGCSVAFRRALEANGAYITTIQESPHFVVLHLKSGETVDTYPDLLTQQAQFSSPFHVNVVTSHAGTGITDPDQVKPIIANQGEPFILPSPTPAVRHRKATASLVDEAHQGIHQHEGKSGVGGVGGGSGGAGPGQSTLFLQRRAVQKPVDYRDVDSDPPEMGSGDGGIVEDERDLAHGRDPLDNGRSSLLTSPPYAKNDSLPLILTAADDDHEGEPVEPVEPVEPAEPGGAEEIPEPTWQKPSHRAATLAMVAALNGMPSQSEVTERDFMKRKFGVDGAALAASTIRRQYNGFLNQQCVGYRRRIFGDGGPNCHVGPAVGVPATDVEEPLWASAGHKEAVEALIAAVCAFPEPIKTSLYKWLSNATFGPTAVKGVSFYPQYKYYLKQRVPSIEAMFAYDRSSNASGPYAQPRHFDAPGTNKDSEDECDNMDDHHLDDEPVPELEWKQQQRVPNLEAMFLYSSNRRG